MSIRRNTLIVAACAAAGLLSSPPASADETTVNGLIADLSSPQFPVRHRAEKELSQLGSGDLPHVIAALEALPADATEARLRLGRVAKALGARSIAGSTHCQLNVQDANAREVVAALAEQSGMNLSAHSRLPGFDINATADGDFWPTIVSWCRANRWDLNFSSGGPQNLSATVVAAGSSQNGLAGIAHASGPALFTVRGAAFEQIATFTQIGAVEGSRPARQRTFTYDLAAHLEPRFQIGDRIFTIEWTDARDGRGRSLLPWHQEAMVADAGMMMGGVDERQGAPAATAGVRVADQSKQVFEWRSGRLPFRVDLVAADPADVGEVTLSGRLKGLVGGELTDVEADLAGGTAEWTVAGEPILVRLSGPELVRRSGRDMNEWQVVFESLRPLPEAVERLVIASLSNASLFDDTTSLRRGATRTRRGDDGRVQYAIDFLAETDGSPQAIKCRVPKRAVQLDIPFEFQGLPTP